MKRIGRGVLVLVVAGLVVVGGIAAERVGPAGPAAAGRGTAVSSVWLCPHGGGKGWSGTIALADPGPDPVEVRLTELSSGAPSAPVTITVPAGREVLQPVKAGSVDDATYIEVFGGWVAAGWLVRSAPPTTGLGVEPCAPTASRTWYTTDADTQQHHRSYLVVMNPFSVEAVFDVALFRPRLPPVRSADWIDRTLPPGRSIALNVGAKVLGQEIVGAEVDVSRGRVAAASLSVTPDGGLRSVLGAPATTTTAYLPVAGGAGQSELAMFVPGAQGMQFAAQLLSSVAPQAAGTAGSTQQPGASTAGYPIISIGPSSVNVTSDAGVPFVATLRARGQQSDDAATGGAVAPATAWVVTPTVDGEPAHPQLVLVDPGPTAVRVTLQLLTPGSGPPGPQVTITVPAGSVAGAPKGFLEQADRAAVLVTADGPIVALGASSSGGAKGLASYGSAVGVPVPLDTPGFG
jgi:hypothetical protein